MPKTVAIVQARMGASRLPNKMMLFLHGYPVIEWIRRRCLQAERIDALVFALPDTADNDVLHDYLEGQSARVFRGSENDVVERYYLAAQAYEAEEVIRICADNPLVAGSEIDRLVDFFHSADCDYAYNHVPKGNSYPDGLGAEITTVEVLEKIHRQARLPDFREHVFNYVRANADRFSIRTFDPGSVALCHPELRMDLDTLEDYRRLMRLDIHIDMSAEEAVAAVEKGEDNR